MGNLTYVAEQVANESALSRSGTEFIAGASIYVNGTSTTLYINDSDCTWLKLNSTSGDISYLRFDGVGEIENTKITSWNTTTSDHDRHDDASFPRSYVQYMYGSRGNITNSNLSYLGYNAIYKRGVGFYNCANGIVENSTFAELYEGYISGDRIIL